MNENEPQIILLKLRAFELLEKSQLLAASVDFTTKLIGDGEIENDDDFKKSITHMNRLRVDYEELLKMEKEYESIRIKLNSLDGNKNILKELEPMEPMDFNLD
jgi:hypothetical protein